MSLQSNRPSSPLFNMNDLINLTCISGPSKPAATLVWLLNDAPILSSSKWLTLTQSKPNPLDQLTESRLTLSFRLNPSHLLKANNSPSERAQQQQHHYHHYQTRNQVLKLRCLSKLSVEFSSETNIVVSGGANLIKKRQQLQEQATSQLPAPSSLRATIQAEETRRGEPISASGPTLAPDRPVYRWPRPLVGLQETSFGDPQMYRHQHESSARFVDTWTTASRFAPAEQAEELEQPTTTRRPSSARSQLVVWTSRQLKAQSEHIDQLVRLSRPNELDTPLIEAKTLPTSFEGPDASSDDSDTTNDESGDLAPRGDVNWDTNGTATEAPTSSKVAEQTMRQDYELNELVQFTCKSRMSPPERDSTRRIQLKWFINGKEVSLGQVNAFDGSKFYYSRDQFDRGQQTNRHSTYLMRHPNPSNERAFTTEASDILGLNATLLSNHELAKTVNQSETNSSQLLVEFTPSLFQLKELNLKCQVLVEQPLIEFESLATIPVGSASKYIQVDQQQHRHNHNNKNPSSRNSSAQTRGQTGRVYQNQQRGFKRNGSATRLGVGSPAASLHPSWLLLELACLIGPLDLLHSLATRHNLCESL